jgi:UDP-N-acetylmuramoyl-tripeptide--D-alanyl-D-alanine ligase
MLRLALAVDGEVHAFAIINADSPYAARLAGEARKADAQIMTFGDDARASARLLMHSVLSDRTAITASILGKDIAYSLGAPGRHLVQNSLAVLLAARVADVDVKAAAEALGQFRPPVGRGQRHVLHVRGARATLLDESYNANPASMRAAIEVLAQARSGRRIAVLGDMLELGHQAEDMHRDLAGPLENARVDLVFAAGPHMRALFEALPGPRRGAWAATAAEIEEAVIGEIRPGDVVMVKGSLGSKMGPIVAALNRRFAAAESAA